MYSLGHPTGRAQPGYGIENFVSRARNALATPPTTAVERYLLAIIIAFLPIEDHIPSVGGFSLLFILFGVLGSYVFLNRARTLNRIWLHPTFLAAYVLLLFCILSESGHPNPEYTELSQLGFMFAGSVLVATLCRDKTALRTALYGYIIGSLWLSVVIVSDTYGILGDAVATSYRQASAVRDAASEHLSLEGNLNQLGFLAVQGGVVAMAMTLTARSGIRCGVMLGVTAFCFLGAFLTMSRGGIGISILCCATILFIRGAARLRTIVITLAVGILLLSLVPDVVFERFTYSEDDGRARAKNAAVETVSQYFLFGVGSGNFWSSWGVRNGFVAGTGKAIGAHNTYLQITIYWGILALLCLLALIWQAFRCIPKLCGNDALALCLSGIALSLLLMLFFSHNFYDKWYSLGLGLLVGVNHWIWPNGIVYPDADHSRASARSLSLVSGHTSID